MKNLITVTVLTLATVMSFAQEVIPSLETSHAGSTRTRAEVNAELQAALASGWRPAQGEVINPADKQPFVSTRTRAQVQDELKAAIASGEGLSHGELSPELQQDDHATIGSTTRVASGKTKVVQ